MYRVIKFFTDLQDNGYAYHEGDIYPREGVEPTQERVEELSTCANKRGTPLVVLEDISTEASSEAKEDTREKKTTKRPSKTAEAKKNGKKTRGEIC